MEKYQQALIENIRKQVHTWFESSKPQDIQNLEVYRFLHSVTGTAGTIGLSDLSISARQLMQPLKEEDDKSWKQKELRDYLMPLLSLCGKDEAESLISYPLEIQSKSDKPLILVIDDDTTFLMYIKEELEKQNLMVIAMSDLNRAFVSLYDLMPDCVLIDVHMGMKNGFEVLTHLKETMNHQLTPVMMMSVDNSKETRMKSFQMGADDFLKKPFDIDELVVRIKRHLDRKATIDQLVLIDELTRVNNRKFLSMTYEQLQKNRNNSTFSLAILDIDHFKKVNDTYGHVAGDEVLKSFALFLKNNISSYESVVRLGGEEFVLLFPNTNSLSAQKRIEELQEEFYGLPVQFNDNQISVTFSCGIIEVTNNESTLSESLKFADSALYEAKTAGRNCVKLKNIEDPRPVQKKLIKVGIVDDDPIIRTMLTEIVDKLQDDESLEIEINSFKDGVEFFASDWYISESPYVIILDGIMPRMDGLEILQKLRSERNIDQYMVVMLTSRKSEHDISRALQLGADDYMTKPFNLLELEARLRRLIQRMK